MNIIKWLTQFVSALTEAEQKHQKYVSLLCGAFFGTFN